MSGLSDKIKKIASTFSAHLPVAEVNCILLPSSMLVTESGFTSGGGSPFLKISVASI